MHSRQFIVDSFFTIPQHVNTLWDHVMRIQGSVIRALEGGCPQPPMHQYSDTETRGIEGEKGRKEEGEKERKIVLVVVVVLESEHLYIKQTDCT